MRPYWNGAHTTDFGSTLTVKWNAFQVYSAAGNSSGPPYAPVDVWLDGYFSVNTAFGTTGQLKLIGWGGAGIRPDVGCLERIDGPPGCPSDVGLGLEIATDTSAKSGDSVDSINGGFVSSSTDLAVPGKGIPLVFSRSYSSRATSGKPGVIGTLGAKWSNNWQSTINEFDSGNHVLLATPGGCTFVFAKSGSTYTASAGVFATLVKNGGGDWSFTTKAQVVYAYNSAGKLTSVKDRNGNTTSLTYDTNSRLTTVTDPGGRTLTVAYNAASQISTVTDPLSRQVGFSYNSNGDLTSVTDVKGGTTSYTYNGHLLTKITDANSHDAVTNTYDGFGRVLVQVDAVGATTTFAYSTPGDGATRMTDARSHTTTTYFDQSMRITDVLDAGGNTTSFAYDTKNNKTCVTDPLGHKTGYTYDTNANVTAMIDANNTNASCTLATGGVQTTIGYTSKNDIDTETDARGNVTHYVYDASGNRTEAQRKDAGGTIRLRTCYTVNSAGLLTARTRSTTLADCTGNTTGFGYDSYGNNTSVTNPRFYGQQTPPQTTATYDLGGRALTATNELSHTTTLTYDNQNNVLTATDNLTHVTTNTYDAKGSLRTVTDANAKVTTYNYDAADRLTSVVDANSKTTSYTYDGNGNRASVTNAKRQPVGTPESGAACGSAGTGNGVDDDGDGVVDDGCPSAIYAYDNLNHLTSQTDALDHVWSYTYDASGRLANRTDPKSQLTSYSYNSRNDLTTITYPGSVTTTFSYDAARNRSQMVDTIGTTTYGYDAVNRLTSVTFPGSRTVSYAYANAGPRATITYPGGTNQATYAYDAANNLSSVTDWNSKQTSYAYDNAGKPTTVTLPSGSGITGTYSYDTADRLTGVSWAKGGSTLASASYTLDNAGNRTQRVDPAGTHTYAYDNLYRLTSVTYPGPSTTSYTFDAAGNRLTLVTGTNTTSYAYDAADELTSVTPPGQSAISYSYDNNENLTARGSATFSWDAENRLTSATVSSTTTTFAYNGDGLRNSLTTGGNTTTFSWDVASSIPQGLYDGTLSYVYGLGRVSQVNGSGTTYYYLADGLGSTMALADSTGTLVNTYNYDVFGSVSSSTGTQANDFKFTGEQADASTGLEYLRARYHDPAVGRFISRDSYGGSAGQPRSQNRFNYVEGNPVGHVDPTGLAKATDCGFTNPFHPGSIPYNAWSAGGICGGTALGHLGSGRAMIWPVWDEWSTNWEWKGDPEPIYTGRATGPSWAEVLAWGLAREELYRQQQKEMRSRNAGGGPLGGIASVLNANGPQILAAFLAGLACTPEGVAAGGVLGGTVGVMAGNPAAGLSIGAVGGGVIAFGTCAGAEYFNAK